MVCGLLSVQQSMYQFIVIYNTRKSVQQSKLAIENPVQIFGHWLGIELIHIHPNYHIII